jgi:endonuclease-3
MQMSLDLDAAPVLPRLRGRLLAMFGPQRAQGRRDPVSQLIKSLISARTFDRISAAAFERLRKAFPVWEDMAEAPPERIEALIDEVTFADQKARQLPVLLRMIVLRAYALNLDFLGEMPVEQARGWLQDLPGVGCMFASATLNFSTLNRRTLVVDTHVHRIVRRLGVAGRASTTDQAYDALMALVPADWDAEALFELHWLLKGLGQSICTDTAPACGRCPLRQDCPRVDVGVGRKVVAFERPRPSPRQGSASRSEGARLI